MFAGMEAGTSRSMPGTRIREDMKKEGEKATKKRNQVEEEEDSEAVRVAERRKEQKGLAASMLTSINKSDDREQNISKGIRWAVEEER